MDELLATHFAHIYTYEPLYVYASEVENFEPDDPVQFDLLQTTIYPTVRFKPPPKAQIRDVGWRVEFRPMEVQLTDFENAAFAVFIVLLSRTVLHFELNLYVPIPRVDENMEKAHTRDAVLCEKFHFRKNILPPNVSINEHLNRKTELDMNEYQPMLISTIINGDSNSDGFPGLIPLVRAYVKTMDYSPEAATKIDTYLSLIASRASGASPTTARWMREFVRSHREYKMDSMVSEAVCYDLLKAMRDMGEMNHRHDKVAMGLRSKL